MAKEDLKGYSVLIVDDDKDICDIYDTLLSNEGFTTYTAKDGAEGMDAARKYNPSLIILDLMMPIKDGRQMLKELKSDAALKHIPVIIFSALITELEKQDSLANGALDYIEKSEVEEPDQLIVRIKKALAIKD